jgi:hypothetical protein
MWAGRSSFGAPEAGRPRPIATVVGVDLRLADQTSIAECKLDLEGLRAQRERYRELSAALEGTERAAGVLTARFSSAVDEELLNQTLAIERECCEFFRIDYDAADRVLTVRVDDPQLDPALDGLRHALTA